MINEVYLWWYTLLIVDDNTPTKIELSVFDLDETTGLEERQAIGWVGDDFSEIGPQLVELVSVVVIVGDFILIRDDHFCFFCFLLAKFCENENSESRGELGRLKVDAYRLPLKVHPHYSGTGRNISLT